MVVNCKKFEEILNGLIQEKKLCIYKNDNEFDFLDFGNMPCIKKQERIYYYMQVGMFLYLGYTDEKYGITYLFGIEQKIVNNKMQIENIYTGIDVSLENPLERFFKYDEDFMKDILNKKMNELIDNIDVIYEKEYLKGKIQEYLEEKIEKSTEPKPISVRKTGHIRGGYQTRKQIKYNGVVYPSYTKFLNAYGLNAGTVGNRLEDGWTYDEIVKKYGKTNRREKPIVQKVVCNGIEYKSVSEFALKNGMAISTTQRKINAGMKPEEILKEGLALRETQKYIWGKEYQYLGKKMTLKELEELSGVPYKTIHKRLQRGWSVEDAVEKGVEEL